MAAQAQWSQALMELGLNLARLGLWTHLTIATVGVLGLVAGRRAMRPAAAIYGAVGGALVVSLLVSFLKPKLPVSYEMALASGALLVALLGIAVPVAAVVVTSCAVGVKAGLALVASFGGERHWALLGGVVAGAFLAAVLWEALTRLLAPTLGGFLVTLAGWAAVGASGLSPSLFRMPVVWAGLLVAGTVLGFLAGIAQGKAMMSKVKTATAASETDARRRRDAENRERYDKYLGR